MRIEDDDYTPAQDDIEWAIAMLRIVANGGVILLPHTQLIYKVNHVEGTLTLLDPEVLVREATAATHRRAIQVFGMLGYMVFVKEAN